LLDVDVHGKGDAVASAARAKTPTVKTFRLELDKMLEAIRIMQRNGVQVSFPLSPPGLG